MDDAPSGPRAGLEEVEREDLIRSLDSDIEFAAGEICGPLAEELDTRAAAEPDSETAGETDGWIDKAEELELPTKLDEDETDDNEELEATKETNDVEEIGGTDAAAIEDTILTEIDD
jgi:hypothetical protein